MVMKHIKIFEIYLQGNEFVEHQCENEKCYLLEKETIDKKY